MRWGYGTGSTRHGGKRVTCIKVICVCKSIVQRQSYLWYAVFVPDHPNQFIQWEEGVAPYLRGNVLSFGTQGQQLHQVEMIGQVSCVNEHRRITTVSQ